MSFKTLFRCALAAAVAAPLCAHAEPFNAKPGAWEMTTTTVTTGVIVPPDMLAKLTPDQRAKVESDMKARSGKPSTRVNKTCFTQQKLDQDAMIAMGSSGGCAQKVLTKSATKIKVERTCPTPQAYTATQTIEAATPESMAVTSDVTIQGGGKVLVDIKGKWLGASCEGVKGKG